MSHQQHVFCYRNFTILKDQILGHGSYGAVYKARCDQLTCAAKILHPTIVDAYDPGSGKILQRFQQECDFLNRICHPHIVQYLGVCRDPESNLPVLLMELLDSSLTKMLERSPHPISYHAQVDLCSDVSLAVAYLHSNGIIHRDLSGNNVLVVAGRRAKVTDFGMSKLVRSERHFTPLTLCPGTLGYMSPESLKEPPRYTEKLDVFSQGVIMIQVCTRKFPDPGPAMKEIEDPRSPTGTMQVPVLEPERRKKHIDLINPTHPLLPIALTCLEYRERDRLSAEELCRRLTALKESQEYTENCQITSSIPAEVFRTLQQERDELILQVEEKTEEIVIKEEQITEYQQEIAVNEEQITAYQQDIVTKNEEIAMLIEDISARAEQITAKDQENERLRMQLCELNGMLVNNVQVTAQFQETNQQLQKQLCSNIHDLQIRNYERTIARQRPKVPPKPVKFTKDHPRHRPKVPTKPEHLMQFAVAEIKFRWRDGGKSPFECSRLDSVVEGNVAYFLSGTNLHAFDSSTGRWNTGLPPCPHSWGSLAIVKGLLTLVGGYDQFCCKVTNKLVSLVKTEEEDNLWPWIEHFPPMPTSRRRTTASAYQNHLIVAGGSSTVAIRYHSYLDTVEVLNTDTLVWSTAASLPQPFAFASATVCGDRLYILGGDYRDGMVCRSVFSCLLPALLQSCCTRLQFERQEKPGNEESRVCQPVWYVTVTPKYHSTCAAVHGQLIAVGGCDDVSSLYESTNTVYKYNPFTESWNIISYMTTARRECGVAVFKETNELLVVGGLGTNSVEIALF